jgi:hypothetical protein
MKNTVTISIEFSFKGKTLSPSITLELDEVMQSTGHLPSFYQLLATENGFDLYSYEYEMMQTEALQFSNAQGLVSDFISGTELDITAFEAAWHDHQVTDKLLKLANKTLGISNFSENPELHQALLEAYALGQKNRS